MKTVLHLVNSLEIGGLERLVVDLSHVLTDVRQVLVCLRSRGDYFERFNGEKFCLELADGFQLSAVMHLRKIVKECNVDLIHTHNQGPHFYGSLTAKFARIPLVHTKHGQNLTNLSRRKYLDRFSGLLTNHQVAVSDDVRNLCIRKLGVNPRKITTIHNGINTKRYVKFEDKVEYPKRQPFILGVVARLAPEKNLPCLLKACDLLKKEGVDFKVNLVGYGSQREFLGQLTKSLNLENEVDFQEVRHDIPEALNELDLFVLPSLTEGLSLTLLEAMSCQLPVIATAVGGNVEVVEDGHNGLLVESDSPPVLAQAITKLIESPQLRETISKNARDLVVEKFSIQRVGEQYRELYQMFIDIGGG